MIDNQVQRYGNFYPLSKHMRQILGKVLARAITRNRESLKAHREQQQSGQITAPPIVPTDATVQ